MPTVVIRLWEPAEDGATSVQLRGIVEIVGEPTPSPFTGEVALLEILKRAAAGASRRAGDEPPR